MSTIATSLFVFGEHPPEDLQYDDTKQPRSHLHLPSLMHDLTFAALSLAIWARQLSAH